MSNFLKSNFLYIIMIIAIIAGAIVIKAKNFEYSLENMDHQRLEVILESPYDEKEMNKAINEAYNKKHIVRTSSLFETTVAIDAKEFTDEDITAILNKLNEKYGTNYSLKNLKLAEIIDKYSLSDVSSMKDKEVKEVISKIKKEYNLEYTKDELANTSSIKVAKKDVKALDVVSTIKKFVLPLALAIGLILLYMEIRAFSFDKLVFIKALLKLVITEGCLVAVIAIVRLPLSDMVITALTAFGIVQLLVLNIKNENLRKKHKEEEEEEFPESEEE